MAEPLSDDELCAWIVTYHRDHGYAPSIRDVAEVLGYASSSDAHKRLAKLHKAGRVSSLPGQPRTLHVVVGE